MARVRRSPARKRHALADDIPGPGRLGLSGVRRAPPSGGTGQACCNRESRRRAIWYVTPKSALARSFRTSLRGLLGRTLLFGSSSLEDVPEGIISLVAGVLIDRT